LAKPKKLEVKRFDTPDETRTFKKGKLDLVKIGDKVIGRITLKPGWKWSVSVKPMAKTESCLVPHMQYHLSGTLKVVMNNGTERDLKPGDISVVPPGHDARVVGNEPVVAIDL
jgi:mannose-6-phosphate isomerase-like protein (cupin superfamily)